MPLPMVPAPRIAMVFVSLIKMFRTTFECSSLTGPEDSGGGRVGGHGYQENGDIVAPAIAISRSDQGFTSGGEGLRRRRLGNGRKDRGDLLVVDLVGEAVGGEQVDVVRLRAMALDVGLDGGLGTDGARDEIAHRRARGLRGGNLAGAKLLFDQRVVVGELFEPAAAAAVAAAVAYVAQPQSRWIGAAGVGVIGGCAALNIFSVDDGGMQQCDQRGAHAGEFDGLTRLLIDGMIGSLDGGVESSFGFCFLGGARWRCKVREEGVGGQSAGDLSGGGSAHPITDDERTGLRCSSAGVLIAMADA